MPKRPLFWPNERVDLVDMNKASYGFARDSLDQVTKDLILDEKSRVVRGFRIELADQTTNPGEITVYNGRALDREGRPLSNEDSINDSRTITLTGSSTTFYLELEFATSLADTDSRAFFDPTYENTDPIPDGKEVSFNIATRTAEDWSLVTPVSTTGFEAESDPDSSRIPLAVLTTDSSNQITTGVSNPGLAKVAPASVLEYDASIGDSSIRVVDSSLLPGPAGASLKIGADSASEETVTVLSNDRDNGVVTFSPNLGFDHKSGAIVRSAGTANLVKENTDPGVAGFPDGSAHVDAARRLFQGDEERGSALGSSKEVLGERDDLNVTSLKDYVDFMASHVRDIRWGGLHPSDSTEVGAPTTFSSSPRYWESAGSISGSKESTFTIGDGVNSWGDFNGQDETPFYNAVSALPASGGKIFVKPGTYTFTKAVSIAKPVFLAGAGQEFVEIVNDIVAGDAALELGGGSSYDEYRVDGINLSVGGSAGSEKLVELDDGTYYLNNLYIEGQLKGSGSNMRVSLRDSDVSSSSTDAVDISGSLLSFSSFINCKIVSSSGVALGLSVTQAVDVYVSHCYIASNSTAVYCSGTLASHILVSDSFIVGGAGCMAFRTSITNLKVSSCYLEASSGTEPAVFIDEDTTGFHLDGCYIYTDQASGGAFSSPRSGLHLYDSTFKGTRITNNYFVNNDPSVIASAITVEDCTYSEAGILVEGCSIVKYSVGIRTMGDTANSTLNVRSCHINGLNQDETSYGVSCDPLGAFYLTLSQVEVKNLRHSTDNIVGVRVHNDSDNAYVAINDCKFTGFIADVGGCYGVSLTDGGASHPIVSSVSNCFFRSLYGDNYCGAVSLDGSTASRHTVVGNTVDTVGSSNATGNSYGIRVVDCTETVISNNSVQQVYGDDEWALFLTGSVNKTTVSTNYLASELRVSSSTVYDLNVIGNSVYGNSNYAIFLSFDDGDRNVNISDNIVEMSSSDYGIYLGPHTTGDEIYNVKICGNEIRHLNGGFGIYTRYGVFRTLNVSNNLLVETSFSNDSGGIYLRGRDSASDLLACVVSGNAVHGDADGGGVARLYPALYLYGLIRGVISNNSTYWTTTDGTTSIGKAIHGNVLDECSVTGNTATPAAGSIEEIEFQNTSNSIFSNNICSGGNGINVNGTTYGGAGAGGSAGSGSLYGYNID